jgi:hypothetical protein
MLATSAPLGLAHAFAGAGRYPAGGVEVAVK